MVDWITAPQWIDHAAACFLSGYDQQTLQAIIDVGGVDLNDAGQIERESLWDFLEADVLVQHWED
jgi:hypothetical protein